MEISAELTIGVLTVMLFILYRGQKINASKIEKKLSDIISKSMFFVLVGFLVLVLGLKVLSNPWFWFFVIYYVFFKISEGKSIFEPSSIEQEIFSVLIVVILLLI